MRQMVFFAGREVHSETQYGGQVLSVCGEQRPVPDMLEVLPDLKHRISVFAGN